MNEIETFPFANVEPEGIVNTYTLCYPQQGVLGSRPEPVKLTYVLVRGGGEDVAVYVGRGEPQWIVEHGAKLRYREAINFFPHLEHRWYRD